jgi:ATPase subunit of ABC transporter with duplicated ATPase domains
MHFSLTKPYRGLTPTTLLDLPRRLAVVGQNGSGKTSFLAQFLAALSQHAKVPKHAYRMLPSSSETSGELIDPGAISQLLVFSPTLRHTQHTDMDSLLSMGLGRMWISEGQNVLADMSGFLEHMHDPDAFFVLDEMDGHLDYKSKYIFFRYFLPNVKGRVLIASHDPHFLASSTCLDLTDMQYKLGAEYYAQQIASLTPKKKKPSA